MIDLDHNQLGPYGVHPLAAAFPLIEGEEFDALVLDIKRNGLLQPIVLNHDRTMLIDGRNRWRACEAANADPHFDVLGAHYTDVMLMDLIVSLNLARRHLNPGQVAMVGATYYDMFAATTTRGRPVKGLNSDSLPGDSMERAARAVGVSRASVAVARTVVRDAPDLAAKVHSGTISLHDASKQAKARAASKPTPKAEPKAKPKAAPVMLTLRTHDGAEVQYPQPSGRSTFNESMGAGISWAAWSWNPVTGCMHGCEYCYAREIATSGRYAAAYPAGFTPLFHPERLDAPSHTAIPAAHRDDPAYRRVFVCSMADLYGRWVPKEWINAVHASMLAAPQWEYLLLTKFPGRYVGLDFPASAWVGTSVDEQKRVRLAEDAFRKIDGVKVRWLSLEPLREPLKFTDLSMFDWVVIGAQTATTQPTGHVPAFSPPAEWVVRLTDQALEAGCRVHWKPNLMAQPGMQRLDQYPDQ